MIVQLVTMCIDPANAAEFERRCSAVSDLVLMTEKGAVFYRFCKMPSTPGQYRVVEVYRTEQDRAEHGTNDEFPALAGQVKELLVAPPQYEVLVTV